MDNPNHYTAYEPDKDDKVMDVQHLVVEEEK